ncbi:MAG: hypothetical protein GXN98_05215 [Euryarchaeota archaeon]|nr:hypothetical protein [Euryarchaeota archaeon]
MKDVLLAIAEELVLFSPEEARQVLGQVSRSDSALAASVERLVGEGALLPLEAGESVLSTPALLRWSEASGASMPEVREAIASLGLPRRSYSDVHWDALTTRLLGILEEEAKALEKDVVELLQPPKKLEMRYFDLAIEFHRYYSQVLRLSFTEELSGRIPLQRWEEFFSILSRLRELLNRLDYR